MVFLLIMRLNFENDGCKEVVLVCVVHLSSDVGNAFLEAPSHACVVQSCTQIGTRDLGSKLPPQSGPPNHTQVTHSFVQAGDFQHQSQQFISTRYEQGMTSTIGMT